MDILHFPDPEKVPLETPMTIRASKVVIGEGPRDANFLGALLKHFRLNDVQPGFYGGKKRLRFALDTLLRVAPTEGEIELNALAVIIDADRHAGAAFQSARDSLVSKGFPSIPAPCQIVTSPPLPEMPNSPSRIGVFVLPDNMRPGMLETLLLQMCAADPAMACVQEYFACLTERSQHRPAANKEDKARAHAFLASRPIPNLNPGTAAWKDYWDWDSDALDPLVAFLRAL